MTVIVTRCDLWDSAAHFQPEEHPQMYADPDLIVAPYEFVEQENPNHGQQQQQPHTNQNPSTAIARVPHVASKFQPPNADGGGEVINVLDKSTPNPYDPNVVHDKYWVQRRRLFSKFDQGIQLDGEGFYSVTPEIIAHHVAQQVGKLAQSLKSNMGSMLAPDEGIILLDAFCGCGGNSIAFGQLPSSLVSKVICVDMDRDRLLRAAHNAAIYNIPRDKLIFVECNSLFILQYCYQKGNFVLDQPTDTPLPFMPPPVVTGTYAGYNVGGLELLPRRLDAIFMDPPWGGTDYTVLGKTGYDLEQHMKIQQLSPPVSLHAPEEEELEDDFFDSFCTPAQTMSKTARKANFNQKTEGVFLNGRELVQLAAESTSSHIVIYDLPRNTNKYSIAKCAHAAGYRGNVRLEEHFLNGRLKTVTAYMGAEYGDLVMNNDILHPERATAVPT